MKHITLILILLLTSSCLTVKRIERNCDKFAKVCTTERVDTVHIETIKTITKRDTVIEYRFTQDTVYQEIEVEKPVYVENGLINSEQSYLEAGFAWSTAEVDAGVLRHYLESSDTTIQVQLKDALKTIETLRTELKSSSKTIMIQENSNFANFTIKWFVGTLVLVLIGVVILLFRFKEKLLGIGKQLF